MGNRCRGYMATTSCWLCLVGVPLMVYGYNGCCTTTSGSSWSEAQCSLYDNAGQSTCESYSSSYSCQWNCGSTTMTCDGCITTYSNGATNEYSSASGCATWYGSCGSDESRSGCWIGSYCYAATASTCCDDDGTAGWVIAVIVIGCLAAVGGIVGGILCCVYCRRKSQQVVA